MWGRPRDVFPGLRAPAPGGKPHLCGGPRFVLRSRHIERLGLRWRRGDSRHRVFTRPLSWPGIGVSQLSGMLLRTRFNLWPIPGSY